MDYPNSHSIWITLSSIGLYSRIRIRDNLNSCYTTGCGRYHWYGNIPHLLMIIGPWSHSQVKICIFWMLITCNHFRKQWLYHLNFTSKQTTEFILVSPSRRGLIEEIRQIQNCRGTGPKLSFEEYFSYSGILYHKDTTKKMLKTLNAVFAAEQKTTSLLPWYRSEKKGCYIFFLS